MFCIVIMLETIIQSFKEHSFGSFAIVSWTHLWSFVYHVIRNQGSLKRHNFSVTKRYNFIQTCVFSMYDYVLKSMWFSLELHTISACLRFICCFRTVAVHRREWKWKSIYIYSVFMWGRQSGSVECLSYWHTCCVSNGSTETQWHWLCEAVCHAAPVCVYLPSAADSVTCWLYNVDDSLWFYQTKSQTESRIYEVMLKCGQVLVLHLLRYCTYKQFWSTCVLPFFFFLLL